MHPNPSITMCQAMKFESIPSLFNCPVPKKTRRFLIKIPSSILPLQSSWWFQPIWKICVKSSNWIISLSRFENNTYLKPPPSNQPQNCGTFRYNGDFMGTHLQPGCSYSSWASRSDSSCKFALVDMVVFKTNENGWNVLSSSSSSSSSSSLLLDWWIGRLAGQHQWTYAYINLNKYCTYVYLHYILNIMGYYALPTASPNFWIINSITVSLRLCLWKNTKKTSLKPTKSEGKSRNPHHAFHPKSSPWYLFPLLPGHFQGKPWSSLFLRAKNIVFKQCLVGSSWWWKLPMKGMESLARC